MFSGIVQNLGKVNSLVNEVTGISITISADKEFKLDLKIGDSVAVNGVCLTVSKLSETTINFDVIHQTLRETTLKNITEGCKVNLERSLKYGGEIGGHLLSGHISGLARVNLKKIKGETELVVYKDTLWNKYIFNKGYIGINGASLTIAKNEENTFSVYLIPETIRATNFLDQGDSFEVNIEIDAQTLAIVETTEEILQRRRLT